MESLNLELALSNVTMTRTGESPARATCMFKYCKISRDEIAYETNTCMQKMYLYFEKEINSPLKKITEYRGELAFAKEGIYLSSQQNREILYGKKKKLFDGTTQCVKTVVNIRDRG